MRGLSPTKSSPLNSRIRGCRRRHGAPRPRDDWASVQGGEAAGRHTQRPAQGRGAKGVCLVWGGGGWMFAGFCVWWCVSSAGPCACVTTSGASHTAWDVCVCIHACVQIYDPPEWQMAVRERDFLFNHLARQNTVGDMPVVEYLRFDRAQTGVCVCVCVRACVCVHVVRVCVRVCASIWDVQGRGARAQSRQHNPHSHRLPRAVAQLRAGHEPGRSDPAVPAGWRGPDRPAGADPHTRMMSPYSRFCIRPPAQLSNVLTSLTHARTHALTHTHRSWSWEPRCAARWSSCTGGPCAGGTSR
jgi:hypothetical protein